MKHFFYKISVTLILSIIPLKNTFCEVFIVAKINQEIITNIDLDFEKRYLIIKIIPINANKIFFFIKIII